MKEIQVYSPATIANLSCGFDVLGLALNDPIDEMVLKKSHYPGVHITHIQGANLPKIASKNVVGVVLEQILHYLPNNKYGIEVEIYKKIKPGSGIGSSASSAAGAAVGANILFGNHLKNSEVFKSALEGERLASGIGHADNVAPAIFGGFTLIRNQSYNNDLDIVLLPSPKELWVTVVHPQIEILTSEARKMLKKKVNLKDAVSHWGNVGALVAALYKEDYSLLGKSLEDFIIEPIRSDYIPAFKKLKIECKNAGALGGGIAGSGPSVFMLSKNKAIASSIADRMHYIYKQLNIEYNLYISSINKNGVKIVVIN